jgi:tetratricopeptide (TPR) repeat protein
MKHFNSRTGAHAGRLSGALLAGMGLSACTAPAALQPLRMEPNLRVEHAGPGHAQGYVALAQRYEGDARWPEALQAWQKAALAAPDDADVHNALGQAQAAAGDHAAAVAALQRAVSLAPGRAALHNNLGYALMQAGQPTLARAALLQALSLQPDHTRAQANLRRLDAASAGPAPAQTASASGPASPPAMTQPPAPETTAETAPKPAPAAASPPGVADQQAQAQAQAQVQVQAQAKAQALAPEPEGRPHGGPLRRVEIANGNGVEGMAACVAERLRALGAADSARLRNALPYNTMTTVVRYRAGHDQAAQALARQLQRTGSGDVPAVAGVDRADSLDVRVVLGHDLRATGLCARPR